jgi:hypothetical protein
MSSLLKKMVRTAVYGVVLATAGFTTLFIVNKTSTSDSEGEFIHKTQADVPYGQSAYYAESGYAPAGDGGGDGGGGGDDGGDSDDGD